MVKQHCKTGNELQKLGVEICFCHRIVLPIKSAPPPASASKSSVTQRTICNARCIIRFLHPLSRRKYTKSPVTDNSVTGEQSIQLKKQYDGA